MKRYCLALDLKDDEGLIAEYEAHHKKVWPEVLKSICESGVIDMEIYRMKNRLFMIMETDDDFSFQQKELLDTSNERVQQWEKLMWNYQQETPGSIPGEKWRLMDKIFDFKTAL